MIKSSKDSSVISYHELYSQLLEEHQNMERELKESADFLNSLLPSEQELLEIRQKYRLGLETYYLPSSILGGDFYSFLRIEERKLGFYLWDFSGHGVTAAINTFRLNSAINHCNECSGKPGEFLTCLNNTLYKINKKGFFATIFYGVIDRQNHTLEYAAAACPYPLLLSFERNQYKFLDTKEFPLGTVGDHMYQTHSINLKQWQAIILYSDALTETKSEVDGNFLQAESFAKDILKSLNGSKSISAKSIKKMILKEFNTNYLKNIKDDFTFQIITF